MKTSLISLAVAAVVSLGACASATSAGDGAAPTTSTPATPTTTTTTTPLTPVRWTGDFESPLPNGWVVGGCDGDRLHVCVHGPDGIVGDIELNAGYPLDPEDAGLDAQAVSLRWATAMIDYFRADRAQGCAGFTFEPKPVQPVVVDGRPAARGGFVLRSSTGTVVEAVVNHYVVVNDTMTIINTDAYAATGGCLPPSEVDLAFEPDELDQVAPHLDRLLTNSAVAIA